MNKDEARYSLSLLTQPQVVVVLMAIVMLLLLAGLL